jgi:hypothetical protein
MYYRKPFGAAIRGYRKRAGLSQQQLAGRAGLHHNFIGEVKRGEHGLVWLVQGGEVGCGFSNRQCFAVRGPRLQVCGQKGRDCCDSF